MILLLDDITLKCQSALKCGNPAEKTLLASSRVQKIDN